MEPPPPPWNRPSSYQDQQSYQAQTHSYSQQAPPMPYHIELGTSEVYQYHRGEGGSFQYSYPQPNQLPYGYQTHPEPSNQQWTSGHGGTGSEAGLRGTVRQDGSHYHQLPEEPRLQRERTQASVSTSSSNEPADPSVWVSDDSLPDSVTFGRPNGVHSSSSWHSSGSSNRDFPSQQASYQHSSRQGFGMRYHPPPARRTSQHAEGTTAGQGVGLSAVELIAAEKFPPSDTGIDDGANTSQFHSSAPTTTTRAFEITQNIPTASESHPASDTQVLVSISGRTCTSSNTCASQQEPTRGSDRGLVDGAEPDKQTSADRAPPVTSKDQKEEMKEEEEEEKAGAEGEESKKGSQNARLTYQNSFLAKVQKFVARRAEAFDVLVQPLAAHCSTQTPPPAPCSSKDEGSCESAHL